MTASGPIQDVSPALLERLRRAGASEQQIRDAARQGRLALLPAELILDQHCRYTVGEAAEIAGLDEELLLRHLAAMGMVEPQPGSRRLTETHLEAIRRSGKAMGAGVPAETMLRIHRVFSRGVAAVADGMADIVFSELLLSSSSEEEFALGIEEVVGTMREDLGVYLAATMETHLRERVAREAISHLEIEAGQLPGARDIAVCFADLVGFTRHSDRYGVDDATALATTFGELALDVAEPPVRLIKMIGDEAMLVCDQLGALVEAAFELRARADAAAMPPLRVGIAFGPAIERSGDWYGQTVNLASRLTAVAEEGAVLIPMRRYEELVGEFELRELGDVRLKGFSEPVALARVCERSP